MNDAKQSNAFFLLSFCLLLSFLLLLARSLSSSLLVANLNHTELPQIRLQKRLPSSSSSQTETQRYTHPAAAAAAAATAATSARPTLTRTAGPLDFRNQLLQRRRGRRRGRGRGRAPINSIVLEQTQRHDGRPAMRAIKGKRSA